MTDMRFWLYSRVAHNDELCLKLQMERLQAFAQKWSLHVVGQSGDAQSGMTLERTGLQSVKEAVIRKEVDAVLIRDYSRISRDISLADQFIRWLRENGVRVFMLDRLRGMEI